MISELEINAFKSLDKIHLTGLKRITLIGGRNNCGKTSLLEALFLSMDWGNAELLTRHLHWRSIDTFVMNPESSWSPAFCNFDMNSKIQIKTRPTGSKDNLKRTFTVQLINDGTKGASINTKTGTQENIRAPGDPSVRVTCLQGSKTVYDAQIYITHGMPPYRLVATTALEQAPNTRYQSARMRSSSADDAELFGRLDREKRAALVVESLQLIEPKLRSLSVIPVGSQPQLFADVDGLSRKVPVNFLGDGITRLLSMMLQIHNLTDGFFLVDEIENGFHHSVLEKVWQTIDKAAKDRNCQVMATTHSYECLSAYVKTLANADGGEYSYVRLDKTDSGIVATQYDATLLANAIDSDWEVR